MGRDPAIPGYGPITPRATMDRTYHIVQDLRVSLALSNAATMTPRDRPETINLSVQPGSEVVKTFVDEYSGFQAYKIRHIHNGVETFTYSIAATQLSETDSSSSTGQRSRLDVRDWVTNISTGQPQLESRAATQMMQEMVNDAIEGKRVHVTGQSLGGMLGHALGYLAHRELRNRNRRDVAGNLQVYSFGSAGVTDLVRDYLRKREGLNEEIDPALVEDNFLTVFFANDYLPRYGKHFGEVRVMDSDYAAPTEGEKYSFQIPFLTRNLESHLMPGFKRGIEYLPHEETECLPEPLRLPGPLRALARFASRVTLEMRYKRFLEQNGTNADWQACYASPSWSTDRNDRCTDRSQRGCEVGPQRGLSKWCMPEDNPIANARYRASDD